MAKPSGKKSGKSSAVPPASSKDSKPGRWVRLKFWWKNRKSGVKWGVPIPQSDVLVIKHRDVKSPVSATSKFVRPRLSSDEGRQRYFEEIFDRVVSKDERFMAACKARKVNPEQMFFALFFKMRRDPDSRWQALRKEFDAYSASVWNPSDLNVEQMESLEDVSVRDRMELREERDFKLVGNYLVGKFVKMLEKKK